MYTLAKVLTPDELKALTSELSQANFVDGKFSASGVARDVEHNLQLRGNDAQPTDLERMVMGALQRHPVFISLALPARVLPPTFAKYEPGMEYGAHVDAPVMGVRPMRTDLSLTVFLSPPDNYDGGELEIALAGGARLTSKLPAGDAVLYAATTHHRVCPVTRGVRLVAVTWIQSLVRDEAIREILHDVGAVSTSIAQSAPGSLESQLLHKAHNNLLRRFAET